MKLKVQRLIKVWVEDIYNVDEISEDTINKALDNELDALDYSVCWDTTEELGDYDIFDSKNNLIKTIRKTNE